jgi:plastocyanin
MRARFTLALLTLPLALTLSAPATAGEVPPAHVAIVEFEYLPATKTVNVSTNINIVWDNGGDFPHTATSNGTVNFIDTGSIASGESGQAYFYGSGSYPYHCELHEFMTGAIKVKPTAQPSSFAVGGSSTVTYGNMFSKGVTWDLQRRRNGGDWVLVRSASSKASLVFSPSRTGTYEFRARTRDFDADVSGWSPIRKVTVTTPT